MKTYVVSDLHISDGTETDDFIPNADKFLRFLEMVEGNLLIIDGDLFDLWKTDIFSIFRAHSVLVRTILTSNVVFIIGNHDHKMASIYQGLGLKFGHKLEAGEWVIIHGHQLDQTIDGKPERLIARFACWLSDKLQHVFPWVAGLEHWLLEGHRENESYIAKLKKRFPGKKFIIGHSHVPVVYEDWFINCGSWGIDQEKLTYVEINENWKVELKEFK